MTSDLLWLIEVYCVDTKDHIIVSDSPIWDQIQQYNVYPNILLFYYIREITKIPFEEQFVASLHVNVPLHWGLSFSLWNNA